MAESHEVWIILEQVSVLLVTILGVFFKLITLNFNLRNLGQMMPFKSYFKLFCCTKLSGSEDIFTMLRHIDIKFGTCHHNTLSLLDLVTTPPIGNMETGEKI